MRKILFSCFVLLSTVHCQNIIGTGSKTIVITKRLFSPDKSHVAISFYEDYGAMGQSMSRASLVKLLYDPFAPFVHKTKQGFR